MSLQVGRPLPIYRKLMLENKILLFFAVIMVFLSMVVVVSVYWTTKRAVLAELIASASAVVRSQSVELSAAALSGDKARLTILLERTAESGGMIDYLVVFDPTGDSLAGYASTPAVTALLTGRLLVGADTVGQIDGFREDLLPLTNGDGAAGMICLGVEKRRAVPVSRRAAGTALFLLVMPGVLIVAAARLIVRRAVKPLKDLTHVADEISAGNLNPRIDFGVHVNCWEIMDCRRTDCRAYMNYSQQCWYIDGTPCEGVEPRFPQKLQHCRSCVVYQAHRGDEVVQLADSFRHMTNVLKESNLDLLNSSDFQKRLIQNSFDGIIATNEHDVVTIFNQVSEDLVGLSGDEVIGKRRWQEFFPLDLEQSMDVPLSHEPIRRERGFQPREAAIKPANGRWIDVLLAGISLYDRGRHIGKVFFFHDLREIKNLREQLIQSERLAAAGQAAASISHSVRNILDGFNGGVFVYKAGKRHGDEAKMAKGWDMIERNVQIISDLVADLLNFTKDRTPDYQLHKPGDLVEAVIADIGLEQNDQVDLHIEDDGSDRRALLDFHSFHQCLANLLGNSVDAFQPWGDGTITVATSFEGDSVIFSVGDDGMGMNPRTIAKVRKGMYSTKGSKGTGLGLQVVQKIVNEHHGVLSIESEEDKGSTFRIELPVAGPDSSRHLPLR